jgi:glutathione synthase/RimK-type ligase-like ATP-grasp enzyme
VLVVVGSAHDRSARAVVERWASLGAGMVTCEDLSASGWRHRPRSPDRSTAVVRPYDWRRFQLVRSAGPGSAAWLHAARLEDALQCWTELTAALVVNRPSTMASNNSKPYQAALIRSFGIETPETLVTTDPAAALEFWEEHGAIVYKSISSVRSIVSRLSNEHRGRLSDITNCPTQFQEYIPGLDYRLHVVGDERFACEIACPADDYRYPSRTGASVAVRPGRLPQDLIDRCAALVASLGLHFAGIDLRRTPAGEWYCFEVNPSPGFSFYEEATGQPISGAVARLVSRTLL